MLIVGGSDRYEIEYSKEIRSLQSRIEAQGKGLVVGGVGVCENRSFKALEQIHQSPKGFNQ